MTEVTFIFQTNADGSCALNFKPSNISPRHGLALLKRSAPVTMHLLAPTGSTDVIETATLTFADVNGQGWPFAGQQESVYVWQKGHPPALTTSTNGEWTFSAVLVSKGGVRYTLPDPELHVGDGPGTDGAG